MICSDLIYALTCHRFGLFYIPNKLINSRKITMAPNFIFYNRLGQAVTVDPTANQPIVGSLEGERNLFTKNLPITFYIQFILKGVIYDSDYFKVTDRCRYYFHFLLLDCIVPLHGSLSAIKLFLSSQCSIAEQIQTSNSSCNGIPDTFDKKKYFLKFMFIT